MTKAKKTKAKKTVKVDFVLDLVNDILKDTPEERELVRLGAMLIIEQILFETGNYRGFRYLTEEEVKGRPGIRYEDGEHGIRVPCKNVDERFRDCDDTRRQY